eukprot:1342311-Rhodomonas_salina.2
MQASPDMHHAATSRAASRDWPPSPRPALHSPPPPPPPPPPRLHPPRLHHHQHQHRQDDSRHGQLEPAARVARARAHCSRTPHSLPSTCTRTPRAVCAAKTAACTWLRRVGAQPLSCARQVTWAPERGHVPWQRAATAEALLDSAEADQPYRASLVQLAQVRRTSVQLEEAARGAAHVTCGWRSAWRGRARRRRQGQGWR